MDQKFPAAEATRLLTAVTAVRPEVLWVVRETDRRARELLVTLLSQRSRPEEPLLAPLVGRWKWGKEGEEGAMDLRAHWRDLELIRTCELVLVARDRRSEASLWWKKRAAKPWHTNIRIAER
jgi:hypothetical protein